MKLYPITEKIQPKLQELGWMKRWGDIGAWSQLTTSPQATEYGLKEGYVEYKWKVTGRGYESVETKVLHLTEKGKDFLYDNKK
jgi:hypothetical protein